MSFLDRLKGALQGLIGAAIAPHDFYAEYACTVISQRGDNTLDLQADDTRIGSLQGIAIRYGIPGVEVTVAQGARVHVGWENGDPARPYAAIWEPGSLNGITITAATAVSIVCDDVTICDGGAAAIARVGDIVQFTGVPPGLPGYGVITTGQKKAKA